MRNIFFVLLMGLSFLSSANNNTQATSSFEKQFIVGGELADENQWPWIAALVNVENNTLTPWVQIVNCAASFIGEKWLVTAAHCVADANLDTLKVNLGEYDVTDTVTNIQNIKHVYIHPEYQQGSNVNNDIALIELENSINHPAISLLDSDETTNLALKNTTATVLGWGSTIGYDAEKSPPAGEYPDKLLQVELSLLTNEQCKDTLVKAYQRLSNINYTSEQVGITDSMICAHYTSGGKGSCQGDSGGPLVVNTSTGWQQVGIVSHGIGCADADFPEVYTRTGHFIEWINSTTQGIQFTAYDDFPITPQYRAQQKNLTINNNSDSTAYLTFDLIKTTPNSTGFSLIADDCAILMINQSCDIQLTFDALKAEKQSITIAVNSATPEIAPSDITITAEAALLNNDIQTQLTHDASDLRWYSNAQAWQLQNNSTAITSANIAGNQQSAVILTFVGAGTLSFDWSVSSEENVLFPEDPFDALYLFVDDEEIGFISGEVEYTNVSIPLLFEGGHKVTWIYEKDETINAGADKAYLKNVTFTPAASTTISTSKTSSEPITKTEKKSSSGSLHFGLIMLFFALCYRKICDHKPQVFIIS